MLGQSTHKTLPGHALNADASSLLMIILLKGLGDISIVANLKHIFMQAFLEWIAKNLGLVKLIFPGLNPTLDLRFYLKRLAIDVLKQCTVKAATSILRISWDEAYGIMSRAVERGLERKKAEPTPYLGIDEKAIATGHKYMTLV